MKVEVQIGPYTKLCHARPGDVVQLLDADLVPVVGYFLLVFRDTPRAPRLAAKPNQPEGLYADGRELWLVNVESGAFVPPPSFSSRCRIFRDATLQLKEPT